MDIDMSSDFLGALCLALTVILALIAWHLAIRGLAADTSGESDGGDTLEQKIDNAKEAVAAARDDLARAKAAAQATQPSEADARAMVDQAEIRLEEAESSLGTISPGDTLGPLKGALEALTGKQAPTRAFLAFALVTFIFSMVAFGVIDFSVASDQGDDTTTTTTTP